jgi:diguanylate cyclase (GGDEF)-like protein/PAS domain S-box-containing protein
LDLFFKQRQLERSLKQSEEQYKKLVEYSPEPIVVYQAGVIQYVNPACINLLGAKSIEELLGKKITNYFHPTSVDIIERRIKEWSQLGMPIAPTEEKVIRLDGTQIDVEVTGITILHKENPAFLMMYHDITSRKRIEEALRQSEEKYRLITENMTDLVCVIEWDGFLRYASPSHVSVLGFPSEEYEGNRARDWMHQEDFPKVRSQLDEMARTKEGGVIEYRFKDAKGNWIWLEGKVTPVFDVKNSFNHFLVVSREITERRMYEEKLSYMAYHDTLTKLPNRRLFKERLKQALKEAERYGRKIAVMYMDMDKFKHINDTLGHDIGDELLKQFSNRVKNCLREGDTLARQGGDEFTILLTDVEEEKDVLKVANRILSSLQEPWNIDEYVFKTTSSIGIALYPIDGTTRHELMRKADNALYHVKENGRNNIKTYSL